MKKSAFIVLALLASNAFAQGETKGKYMSGKHMFFDPGMEGEFYQYLLDQNPEPLTEKKVVAPDEKKAAPITADWAVQILGDKNMNGLPDKDEPAPVKKRKGFLGLFKKKEKVAEPKPEEKVVSKDVVKEKTPDEKKREELKKLEDVISAAALKELTDYIEKLPKGTNIMGDAGYFQLLSKVKEKERDDIAKLYKDVWKPEELAKHMLDFDKEVCRGQRHSNLLGFQKPELVEKVMGDHDAAFAKSEADRPAREKLRSDFIKMMEETTDGQYKAPNVVTNCEALLIEDKKFYDNEERLPLSAKIKTSANDKYKEVDFKSCRWVPEAPRRLISMPGCTTGTTRTACVGQVVCKLKSGVEAIRTSTCSTAACGEADAGKCTAEKSGYFSKPGPVVAPKVDTKGLVDLSKSSGQGQ